MLTKILARSCQDFIERVLANASHVDIIRFYDLFTCYCQILSALAFILSRPWKQTLYIHNHAKRS